MRILITGATGFLGSRVAELCFEAGHDLYFLGRKKQSKFHVPGKWLQWNLAKGQIDALPKLDAVLHLAGEPVAAKPWTKAQKERIRGSRVDGTKLLFKALRESPPKVIVAASAIGFYGDRGAEVLTENARRGSGFLAETCEAWEKEALADLGGKTRHLVLRLGVVLGRSGGAIEALEPIFGKGLGGTLGWGQERWFSWIHREDAARLFVQGLEESWSGIYNAVAPKPITQAAFAKEMGHILHRPALLGIPGPVIRVLQGQRAEAILQSAYVSPKRLEGRFKFLYGECGQALAEIFGGFPDHRFDAWQWVPAPMEKVFPFFSDAQNLERITPPFLKFSVLNQSTKDIQKGTLINYRLKLQGIPFSWRTLIESFEPNKSFVDTQLKGPYARWHHTHTFEPLRGGVLMRDRVMYRLPLGVLGDIFGLWYVRGNVRKIFEYRFKVIGELYGG